MGIVALIMGLVTPIARRLLIALGIGTVSYVGLQLVLDQITGLINAQLGSVSADIAGLTNLMGIQQSIGILLGAVTAKIALQQLKRFSLL